MATDARAQGILAFQNNLPMSACEYPAESTLRNEWMSGWTQAQNSKPGSPATATGAGSSGEADKRTFGDVPVEPGP